MVIKILTQNNVKMNKEYVLQNAITALTRKYHNEKSEANAVASLFGIEFSCNSRNRRFFCRSCTKNQTWRKKY